MSELVAARAAELIMPHDPLAAGEFVTWVCMDDRPVANVEDMHNGLYRQIGGGAHGYGTDVHAALRVDGPVHHIGGATAKLLEAEADIRLRLHEGCAAEGAAEGIANTIVERPNEVFEGAQVFLPGIDYKTDFLPVRDHYAQTLARNHFQVPQKVAAELAAPRLFVLRVALRDMPHIAEDILADDLKGRAFAPANGLEQGTPAYHVSFGDLEELHGPTREVYGRLSLDALRAASAVRHAAIALNLPRPTEQPLGLYRVSQFDVAA